MKISAQDLFDKLNQLKQDGVQLDQVNVEVKYSWYDVNGCFDVGEGPVTDIRLEPNTLVLEG